MARYKVLSSSSPLQVFSLSVSRTESLSVLVGLLIAMLDIPVPKNSQHCELDPSQYHHPVHPPQRSKRCLRNEGSARVCFHHDSLTRLNLCAERTQDPVQRIRWSCDAQIEDVGVLERLTAVFG